MSDVFADLDNSIQEVIEASESLSKIKLAVRHPEAISPIEVAALQRTIAAYAESLRMVATSLRGVLRTMGALEDGRRIPQCDRPTQPAG